MVLSPRMGSTSSFGVFFVRTGVIMSLSSALVLVAVQVVGRFVFCDSILEYVIGPI